MTKQTYSIVIQTFDEVQINGDVANIHYFSGVDNIRYENNAMILTWLGEDNNFPVRIISLNLNNVATLDAELEGQIITVIPTDVQ